MLKKRVLPVQTIVLEVLVVLDWMEVVYADQVAIVADYTDHVLCHIYFIMILVSTVNKGESFMLRA